MILLLQNSQEYNNDLRAMIMAFFPGVRIVEKQEEKQTYRLVFRAEYGACETLLTLDDRTVRLEGNFRDKQVFRNRLKRAAYDLLSGMTGKKLPWGDLTGVRPTKIAMAGFREGKCFGDVVRGYMDVYDVTERKALLAAGVAKRELALTDGIDLDNDYCLYVGIPFCPSRCLYCSFTSYPIARYEGKASLYIERLGAELAYVADAYRRKRLVSVYVGGGTPTAISHELLDELLAQIERVFDMTKLHEFTVEAGRPDIITAEKLRVLKRHGVTRISINPQTMNNETLRTIGRAHTAEQAREAFAMARREGFDNINMDLIAGLPGERLDSMRYTLEQVKALSPDSITVHSLAIKRAANLRQQMSEYENMINRDTDEMLNMVSDTAAELGMEPYYLYRQKNIGGNLENVGYAKPGLACLYNILIMEELTDIIAVGAGAATKLTYHAENRVERVENCKSVDDYIERFDEMISRKARYF